MEVTGDDGDAPVGAVGDAPLEAIFQLAHVNTSNFRSKKLQIALQILRGKFCLPVEARYCMKTCATSSGSRTMADSKSWIEDVPYPWRIRGRRRR